MAIRKTPLRKSANRKKTILLTIITVLVLSAGGGAAWYFTFGPGTGESSASAQSTPGYYTTTVRRRNLRSSISGSGQLIAGDQADLSFTTRGTVASLNVNLGDTVTTGMELASLGKSEALEAQLASAKLQLLQAQQALSNMQQSASLTLAQAYSDWIKAGQSYQDAETTYQRMQYARCSQSTNTRNAAVVERARESLARVLQESEGSTSSEKYIQAQEEYGTALANYNYCIAYTEEEKAGAKASAELASARMKKAETTYNALKEASGIDPTSLALAEAQVEQAQAAMAQAQEALEGLTLYAPINGKVTYLAASQGAIVDTTTFITISNLDHPTMSVNLDETDTSQLAVGARAEVTFDALPDQVFQGTISAVDPQLTTFGSYQTVKCWVILDSSSAEALRSFPLGLNGTVEVITQEANNALLVPITALRSLGDGAYGVFVVQPDGSLRLTVVGVGVQTDTVAEITGGLNEGDVVSTGISQSNN